MAAATKAPKSVTFDPILRVSELEKALRAATERNQELEYVVAQLNDVKSSAGPGASTKEMVEENAKLKAELHKLSQVKSRNDKLLFSMGRCTSSPEAVCFVERTTAYE
jgi:hypothetical protein